ncbi:hypothetical protein J1N35_036116 [Gossypium stocksii]|uniref:ADP-ribosyl cyclase/cyclic ADP-ribose hydrolase n=1 Tax=Gossypium stocksii TaxID=47602 RepID=A0A9D3ZKH9_9ROSI|nr:hypothetical protein J1N35_036116 [Gossypium stocksii]
MAALFCSLLLLSHNQYSFMAAAASSSSSSSSSSSPQTVSFHDQIPEQLSPAIASSSSSSRLKHQVFLSFRGEDTRHTFTAHLLIALKDKGMNVFFDEETLEKGEQLSQALSRAIAASYLSIIVLSVGYASSKSCLSELSDIMHRKDTQGHIVLPIFYHVDPSDVRNLRGSFKTSFDEHESNRLHQVQRWKSAFTEVGKLKGWHIEGGKFDRPEPEYIKDIVEDVVKKLMTSKFRSASAKFVGIDQIDCFGVKHFGDGSKIIVTSRDRQVFKNGGVDKIHDVRKLNENDSLQLFSTFAFKLLNPPADFRDLSNKFIKYARGSPLALRVLGSKLYKKSRKEWESEVDKLKEYSQPKISQILRSSFDELDELDKNIFLDTVTFFKGTCKEDVEKTLSCCYKGALCGISNLIGKCLLEIKHFREPTDLLQRLVSEPIDVHDMLEEMGKDIVRKESIDPGKRSRLWGVKDVYQVL